MTKLFIRSLFAAASPIVFAAITAQSNALAQNVQDEIIVTATKRAQNVQDVPISLSVFNSADLDALQVNTLAALSRHIPNTYQPPATQAGQHNITIRGIGGGINRSAGRAVGVYIDGVYISADTALNIAMADIEQVEVLRGPQGTLFGRNTIGGAINITTKTPRFTGSKINGKIALEYGSFGRKQIRVSANIPLVEDKLSLRVSGLKLKTDGHIKNLNGDGNQGGRNLGRENHTAYKTQIAYAPNANLSARLSYDYQKLDDHPNSQGEPVTNIGSDKIPYTVNIDQEEGQEQIAMRAVLHLDYEMDNGFTLSSISAWSHIRDFYIQDGDRLPQAITVNQFDGASEDFSQELRISSPQYERYDYLIGLYYLYTQALYSPTFPLMSTAFLDQVFFLPRDQHPPNELDGQRIITNNRSVALYAHGNFNVAERLSLFGGLRYTHEEKDLGYSIFGEVFNLFGLPPLQTQQSLSNDPFSWTFGGRYRVNETTNVYTSVARAYRSASVKDDFIGQADISAASGFFTKPEFVTNYEAGLKLRTTDSRLRANASVFYMDYTDIQVSVSQEPFLFLRTLTNAAKAHIWGFEVDAFLKVTNGLNLSASTGFLKTQYDEFTPEPGRDLSGTGFGTAPEWSFSAALDYKHSIASGMWTTHLDYKNQKAPNNFELRTLPFVGSHTILNASTAYVPDQGNWSVKLWVKNLTNINRPVTNFHWGAGLGPLLDNITVQYELPRSYGLTVKMRYGQN